jgi:hypothetical protein
VPPWADAADPLHLTQPTISKRTTVRELEIDPLYCAFGETNGRGPYRDAIDIKKMILEPLIIKLFIFKTVGIG